jgi:predicted nuclease of predicted toxin-antitoxin system
MKPLHNGMLPPGLVRRLADLWPDAKHVMSEYGEKAPDELVWAEAKAHGYTIITKDSDFSDPQKHPGPPPKAVRLMIGNANPAQLETYQRAHAAEIEAFAASGERHIEI